jgi:hypothetical protein
MALGLLLSAAEPASPLVSPTAPLWHPPAPPVSYVLRYSYSDPRRGARETAVDATKDERVQSVEVTISGTLARKTTTLRNGRRLQCWIFNDLSVEEDSEGGLVPDLVEDPLDAFSWISARYFVRTEVLDKCEMHVYRLARQEAVHNAGLDSPESAGAQDIRGWIDARTRLPRRYDNGEVRIEVEYLQTPPSSLKIPRKFFEVFDTFRKKSEIKTRRKLPAITEVE